MIMVFAIIGVFTTVAVLSGLLAWGLIELMAWSCGREWERGELP